jgi:methylenetetrahydrofolate reductase (NADPH)
MPQVSFEFFPPKSAAGLEKLLQTAHELATLEPEYLSVTYGAGGSTRERTLAAVEALHGAGLVEVAPHLSGIGADRGALAELLHHYEALGIRRVVALRGDPPSGMVQHGPFPYAEDLVRFIREQSGDRFHVEVAAYPETHPQSASPNADLRRFVDKVRAGADGAITQYFYNADAYFCFCDEARRAGVEVPIVPGIMPITNYTQLARFSDACGAEIPRWIRRRLEGFGDDMASLRRFGQDVVTELSAQLLAGGAPGLHFYTLNQAAPSREIWQSLTSS